MMKMSSADEKGGGRERGSSGWLMRIRTMMNLIRPLSALICVCSIPHSFRLSINDANHTIHKIIDGACGMCLYGFLLSYPSNN